MGDLVLKYAHLSNRDTPRRRANRLALQKRIEEIWAEQEQKNAELRARVTDGTRLLVGPRYATGMVRHDR
jgi:predicted secreted Zn-dependent protease